MFIRTIVSAVVLLSFVPLAAQEKGATDSTATPSAETEVLWHEAKVLIPTRVLFPPEFDAKHPHTLIVALHAFSESAEVAQPFVEELAAKGFLVAIPEAAYPLLVQGRIGYGWSLFHKGDVALTDRAGRLAVNEQIPPVVTDLRQRYRIDRVFILGASEGAMMALATAINNGWLFDGVVSFFPPAFDTSWFTGNTLTASSGVRVLLMHGREDMLARFAVSEHARDALKDAGYDVTFRPFSGGHTVTNDHLDFVAKWIRNVSP
ncbi:MAG: alpha/beta hydrolase [Planctomycetota bacterium]|jgi:predicted esterase